MRPLGIFLNRLIRKSIELSSRNKTQRWILEIVAAGFAGWALTYLSLYMEVKIIYPLMIGREYTVSEYGIHWDYVLGWLPAILVFGSTGICVAKLANMEKVMRYALMLGLFAGVCRWSLTTVWFSGSATLVDKLWAQPANLTPLAVILVVSFLTRHLRYLKETYG